MGDEKKKKKGLPLKDMVKRKCHVCGRMYVNAKSVVRHIKDKHPLVFKDPNFKETLAKSKVTPKRKCPYCGKEFSGANYKHIKLCNRRPDLVLRPAQEPGQAPMDEVSPEEFLELYKRRVLSSSLRTGSSTATSYVSKIRYMIKKEKELDAEFSPHHWFLRPNDPRFRTLRVIDDYQRWKSNDWKSQSTKQLCSAYSILWRWIEYNLSLMEDSARARHANLLPAVKDMMRSAGKGHFDAKGKTSKEGGKEKPPDWRIDLALTRSLIDSYYDSAHRQETLDNFVNGDYSFPEETGLEPGQARLFLSLEIFVRGMGIRLDPVRNLTVHDILWARPTLSECPYCHEKVVWDTHKDVCQPRIAAVNSNNTHEKENDVPTKKFWMIEVEEHKTGKTAPIELVWEEKFYKMVLRWISSRGFKKRETPFAKTATWPPLEKCFKKFVDGTLMAKTLGKLGPKDFRRYYINKILSEGKDVILKLRALGTSEGPARRNYANKDHISFLRADAVIQADKARRSLRFGQQHRQSTPAVEPSDNTLKQREPVGSPSHASTPVLPRKQVEPVKEVEAFPNSEENQDQDTQKKQDVDDHERTFNTSSSNLRLDDAGSAEEPTSDG